MTVSADIETTTLLAALLKRLYPQNPDVVLGREARIILEEMAAHGLVVVDCKADENDSDLEGALRGFLEHTRPPSGAFGQSMEATMAYEAVKRLRAVAAAHLRGVDPYGD